MKSSSKKCYQNPDNFCFMLERMLKFRVSFCSLLYCAACWKSLLRIFRFKQCCYHIPEVHTNVVMATFTAGWNKETCIRISQEAHRLTSLFFCYYTKLQQKLQTVFSSCREQNSNAAKYLLLFLQMFSRNKF